MKRLFFIVLLLSLSLVSANNLYQQDSVKLKLDVNGGFELISKSDSATLKEVSAQILLYPEDDFRQEVIEWQSNGDVDNNQVQFEWSDGEFGKKSFGYSAVVKTNNYQNIVSNKIPFPIEKSLITDYEDYLFATQTIDANDPAIIAKAAELAEGEDDLFKVVFNLADWVEKNVDYDLNTLTESASQKASWVLQNKQGVCDEMTSLFVAMSRSLGIPARFVSGISYTTSDLFEENWQPHGWAEVYFPEVGWVSFDITFGEYGYVDVTHIKLRDGFDPQEPATKYQWVADKVDLETEQLDFDIFVVEEGEVIGEAVSLEVEVEGKEVGFGSYNVVKGVLKNNADYYAASTLRLAVPKEVEILGRNRRTILLAPKEVKETTWVVKVPNNLENNFKYTFPTLIYTEKNVSVQDMFSVQAGKNIFSKLEVEKLLVKDEEKTYSRKISFSCDYNREIKLNEESEVSCFVKNVGNANLYDLSFCLGGVCDRGDLLINQEMNSLIKLKADEVGWGKILVSANNDLVEKTQSFEYAVFDEPKIDLEVIFPDSVNYGDIININIKLQKDSFSTPKNVMVKLKGTGFENKWEIERITQDSQSLPLELENYPLASENEFVIDVEWIDKDENKYTKEEKFVVEGVALSFPDKIKMFFNRILKLFN